MAWPQNYDPLGNLVLSALVAVIPIVVLLGLIGLLRVRVHLAAVLGLGAAMVVAVAAYHMPLRIALATAAYGTAYGLFPIGWVILNVMYLYQLTVRQGRFELLRVSLAGLTPDGRVQVILIAFSLGSFLEGVAGFGTPVAITAAILIQLGFRPVQASGLALIANTAPVAFGSLGIPITTLAQVTGLDPLVLSKMVGRQLPFFSVIVPFWVVFALAGWRGLWGIWPAALTAGVAFAVPQFLVSNLHGPWLVDIVSAACSMMAMMILLRFWQPREIWRNAGPPENPPATPATRLHPPPDPSVAIRGPFGAHALRAWMPWMILTAFIFVWGLPQSKQFMSSIGGMHLEVPWLHGLVQRMPPVAPLGAAPEKAIFEFNWIGATGTAILLSALLAGFSMGCSPRVLMDTYFQTVKRIRFSLLTIAAMLAIGHVTRYSGTDATLGLALAHTGSMYPFFGTLLGWLGVALTGSDTASNVLFGSLQRITAEQTGLNPVLMCAANSSGGVMGKMIDAQSIVVASTATGAYGREGDILRFVFFHSVALAALVGLLVSLQAYVFPFTAMVAK